VSSNNLTNATAIGEQAVVTLSNTMEFGNTSVVGWGFGYAIPSSTKVLIVGTNSTNGNGAYLTSGGMWTNASDKNLKEDFTNPNGKDVLSHIKKLSVTKWKYKGTNEYHIGPMAQDFYSAFNLGTDDKHIGTTDPAGIALIAIQELATQNDSLQSANTQQQQTNASLQQQLNDLKNTIAQMQTAMSQCCNSFSSSMQSANINKTSTISFDQARLEQNAPNPYNATTLIQYYLPASTVNAQLSISDMSGHVLKTIALNGNGNGQVKINSGTLFSGNYFYSLLVDGKITDTKQMTLLK
jgi:hypothetical protein